MRRPKTRMAHGWAVSADTPCSVTIMSAAQGDRHASGQSGSFTRKYNIRHIPRRPIGSNHVSPGGPRGPLNAAVVVTADPTAGLAPVVERSSQSAALECGLAADVMPARVRDDLTSPVPQQDRLVRTDPHIGRAGWHPFLSDDDRGRPTGHSSANSGSVEQSTSRRSV